MTRSLDTKEKILHFGKEDFLKNGFKNASLRNIAKGAGVTTGAIYGYFRDKDALFEELVAPVCKEVGKMFSDLSKGYYTSEGVVSGLDERKSLDELKRIFTFIYRNFDVFRLLVTCSEGSARAGFVNEMVEYEAAHTNAYLEALKKDKQIDFEIDPAIVHILSDSYIGALMEPVRHGMSYTEAIKHAEFLSNFYTGGWKTVLSGLLGE